MSDRIDGGGRRPGRPAIDDRGHSARADGR